MRVEGESNFEGIDVEYIKKTVKFIRKKNKSYSEQLVELIFVILPIAFVIRTLFYGLYQVPTGSMETTMLVGERFLADKFTILFKDVERGMIISFNDPNYHYSSNPVMRWWQEYVWGPSNWTKRVIGIPGDSVRGRVEDGKTAVYLKKKGEAEFKKLDEPYLNKYPIIPIYTDNLSMNFVHSAFNWRSYDSKYSYADQPFYVVTPEQVQSGKAVAKYFGEPAMKEPGTIYSEGGKSFDTFDVELADDEYWLMGDNRLGSHDSRAWGPLKKRFIHGRIVFRIWSLDSPNAWWPLDLLRHPIGFWSQIRWSRCWQKIS